MLNQCQIFCCNAWKQRWFILQCLQGNNHTRILVPNECLRYLRLCLFKMVFLIFQHCWCKMYSFIIIPFDTYWGWAKSCSHEMLGHFNLITIRCFGDLATSFHFVFFEIKKEDSCSLNSWIGKLLPIALLTNTIASCSQLRMPIVSSCMYWDMCAEVSHVVLFCFLCILVHVLWVL